MSGWMIGVDTGGTFTDLVAVDTASGQLRFAKVASVPSDPSQAVMNALEEVFATGIAPADVAAFVHGTTVATNALLEGKGARTGLVITRGFRAVYETRGWSQPTGSDLIDPFYRKPPMLVPQRLTQEVTGRLDWQGQEITPLDEDDVRNAARSFREAGVESVAVCLLFSFLDARHERRIAEIFAQEAPAIRVSLSSAILPVIREYNRLSTTVVDAYVSPLVQAYLGRLAEKLRARGVASPRLFVMQSNGGLALIETGARAANQLLLSGPAAGLVAAADLGRLTEASHVVTFDMGGTSTDIGVIIEGRVGETSAGVLAGQDIGTPMLRVRTLGAGGGTIAHIGKDGLLKVGPESAGALPGPACYGRGGVEPTVTDANLVIGALGASKLAGGLSLNEERARSAIETRIATPLGLSVTDAAIGVLRIVNNAMAVDLRLALQEQGQDPRRFALMAFGGAGPIHAVEVARMVRIPQVIVPLRPGLNCALGLLQTQVRHAYLRSSLRKLTECLSEEVNAIFRDLEAQARADIAAEGLGAEPVAMRHIVEMRYLQQGYQLGVPCPATFTEADKPELRRAFDTLHRQTYGQAAEDEAVEIVTFRLIAEIEVPKLALPRLAASDGNPARALKGARRLYDTSREAFVEARLYDRDGLRAGDRIEGPAIIEQLDATTIVLSGQTLDVDDFGTLVIDTGASHAG
jgi:N-methylhydantoinase A